MFKKDLKTGYIDYSINVETPLFISDGEKESDFLRLMVSIQFQGVL